MSRENQFNNSKEEFFQHSKFGPNLAQKRQGTQKTGTLWGVREKKAPEGWLDETAH